MNHEITEVRVVTTEEGRVYEYRVKQTVTVNGVTHVVGNHRGTFPDTLSDDSLISIGTDGSSITVSALLSFVGLSRDSQ